VISAAGIVLVLGAVVPQPQTEGSGPRAGWWDGCPAVVWTDKTRPSRAVREPVGMGVPCRATTCVRVCVGMTSALLG